MKKILNFFMHIFNVDCSKVISNEKIDYEKVKTASNIITELQNDMKSYTDKGSGPFVAAIYNDKNELVVKVANSVVNEHCSNNHAEMNAIKAAESKLGTFDLAPYNLKLYVTAEPCMMCIGGIMWSGIKEVYYGVPSKSVEKITGFDEGFKPNWFEEFKKRGITVYGNIATDIGEEELRKYVNEGKNIYTPSR
ncbi:nucleoside deaminase [bacterium]|nr:nucleoside deaminase [bacterium]